MTGIPRTIIVKGKSFNTEHKLNEYSHVKPIKQKRKGLGPNRNTAACKEVEELTKAGILREVKCLFLGHLISKQGIRAKPSKVKAITNVEQPKTLKDVQSLNEKIAALSRFLLKGVERSLPFFKVLKSCTDKKNIQWTQEVEAALQKMRKFVEILPILTAPVQGEILLMYLTASTESISGALFAKREEEQQGGYEGLMLTDPEGKEYTYALSFRFETTNNEAEYEALLAGLRISQEMEIISLAIFVDLQLLEVLVEVQLKWSIEEKEILQVETKEGESWMTPIHEYLVIGLLPEDPNESRKIRVKAPQYKLIRGNLYRISFYTIWIRGVASPQTDDIVKEVHKGSCGFNARPRSMVVRITKQGYYWPSMHRAAAKVLQYYKKCTEQSAIRKVAESSAITARSGWPFSGIKTSDRYKRKACRKICIGIHGVQIWSATNNQLKGREAFLRRNFHRSLQRIKSYTVLLSYYEAYGNNEPYRKTIGSKSTRMGGRSCSSTVVQRTLLRDSQKEVPFSLTYGSEAKIPIPENDVAKDDRGRINEVDKRRRNKEISSIEEAYYRSKLCRLHSERSSHFIYMIRDFVLISQSNTGGTQETMLPMEAYRQAWDLIFS
nr:hypothetical protein [Tanacetum cinerariifolium]